MSLRMDLPSPADADRIVSALLVTAGATPALQDAGERHECLVLARSIRHAMDGLLGPVETEEDDASRFPPKLCRRCGRVKPLTAFPRDSKARKDGRHTLCCACHRVSRRRSDKQRSRRRKAADLWLSLQQTAEGGGRAP